MKPIEPGCLAVVVPGEPENAGKVVRVGRCLGRTDCCDSDAPYWETDQAMAYFLLDESRIYRHFAPECCLLRIDGYEESETIEEEATA